MNTKHTPGPWHVRNGNTIGDATQDIASLSIMSVINMKKDERIANARLIAAAPDLLEALLGIIEAEQSEGMPGTGFSTKQPTQEHQQRVYNAWQKAHAAIAKATGGAA